MANIENILLLFSILPPDGIIPDIAADPALPCSSLVGAVDGEPTVLSNLRRYGARYDLESQLAAASASMLLYGCLVASNAPYTGLLPSDDYTLATWRFVADFAALAQLYPRNDLAPISVRALAHTFHESQSAEHMRFTTAHGCPVDDLLRWCSGLLSLLRTRMRDDLPGPALLSDERDGMESALAPLPAPSPPGGAA